jgi:cytochrome c556
MSRKWIALASSMVSVAFVVTGLALAADDEGPLHGLMEKVNKNNNSIKKAIRTPVAFKKAGNGKEVATQAEDLVKLAKKAKEITDAAKKAKDVPNAIETWNTLMDALIKSGDEVAVAANKGDYLAAKAAHKTMTAKCTACHEKFRIEDAEDKP